MMESIAPGRGHQSIAPFLTNDPDRLRRFQQEAQAAAALNHPNILAVYQMRVYECVPYLVSKLLEYKIAGGPGGLGFSKS